jgi:hypothetical protein
MIKKRKNTHLILLIISSLILVFVPSCIGESPIGSNANFTGQWIFNISQAYDPPLVFTHAVDISNVKINGKYYFILTFYPSTGPNNSRTFIFDAGNPLSPTLVSTMTPPQADRSQLMVNNMVIRDNIWYAGLFVDQGLWMVDLSNPGSPKDLGIVPGKFAGNAFNLVTTGNYIYGVGQLPPYFVTVLDVSDLNHITEVGRISLPDRDQIIAVKDNLLFIADRDSYNLTIMDISSISAPKTLSTYNLNIPEGLLDGIMNESQYAQLDKVFMILDMQIAGNYLYIATGAGGLKVLDISDPATPHEVAKLDSNEFAMTGTIRNNLLFLIQTASPLGGNIELSIIDISNPLKPRIVRSVPTPTKFDFEALIARPQVMGNYVYINSYGCLDIIDLTGKEAPVSPSSN